MPDILTTFTNFINSPPGQLVAGATLGGIVWKFFERVEGVLNEDTKLEIAVWLLGRRPLGPRVERWANTFAKIFDQVFGRRHLSWSCFGRSAVASVVSVAVALGIRTAQLPPGSKAVYFKALYFMDPLEAIGGLLLLNVIPDYISLLESRYVLRLMQQSQWFATTFLLLISDFLITFLIGFTAACVSNVVRSLLSILYRIPLTLHNLDAFRMTVPLFFNSLTPQGMAYAVVLFGFVYIFPAFFTSIWLWLYAGSGFLLKFARRFDIGFEWFNRRFDIEKKPLQSIGLVAGALVAVVYWAAVIVTRLM